MRDSDDTAFLHGLFQKYPLQGHPIENRSLAENESLRLQNLELLDFDRLYQVTVQHLELTGTLDVSANSEFLAYELPVT